MVVAYFIRGLEAYDRLSGITLLYELR